MLLRLIGTKPILEKETHQGRIDAALELHNRIYIIEFKFAQSKRHKNVSTLAAQALKQIEDNGYHRPYLAQGKPVVLLGIGFLDKKKIAGKVKVIA
jgi:deferrochelatase/peroxidase EfeB